MTLLFAISELEKAKGLMGKEEGQMLFVYEKETRQSFHTFFMRFSIDMFFFDKDFNVVQIRKNVRPWRLISPRVKYKYVYEREAS